MSWCTYTAQGEFSCKQTNQSLNYASYVKEGFAEPYTPSDEQYYNFAIGLTAEKDSCSMSDPSGCYTNIQNRLRNFCMPGTNTDIIAATCDTQKVNLRRGQVQRNFCNNASTPVTQEQKHTYYSKLYQDFHNKFGNNVELQTMIQKYELVDEDSLTNFMYNPSEEQLVDSQRMREIFLTGLKPSDNDEFQFKKMCFAPI